MDLHLKIAGTGSYLPTDIIDNSYFTQKPLNRYDKEGNVLETRELTDEGIVKVTGIRERRRAKSHETPSYMGHLAAVNAIERAGIKADSLVGIIVATVTEEVNFPSAACKIQEKLGVRNCIAYDISNACAGFPEALAQANSRMLKREGNYLVVAAEKLTGVTDYTDINSTLFGDGAGAAVLAPTVEPVGILAEFSSSDPHDGGLDLIFRDDESHLSMPEGNRVMKAAVREMTECARNLKAQVGWERADVYIPHQANERIIQSVEKNVIADGATVYRTVAKYGNMSAATCPVALDEALRDGTIKEGSKVIMVSFGAGLVTAGTAIQF